MSNLAEYKTSLFYDLIDIQFRQQYEYAGMVYELLLEESDFHNILDAAWGEQITEQSANSFLRVTDRVQKTIEYLDHHTGHGKYFVKLNTVSSKDWEIIPITKNNPKDVVNMLSNSMRVMELGYYPHKNTFPNHPFKLIFKPWVDIQKGCEFRAFIFDGKLVAISRNESEPEPLVNLSSDDRLWVWRYVELMVRKFLDKAKHQHIKNIVFDFFITLKARSLYAIDDIYWIEANPYFLSSPCCFTIEEREKFEHDRFLYKEKNNISEYFKLDYPEEIKQKLMRYAEN